MLINFTISNFRTFYNPVELSMKKGRKGELPHKIITVKLKNNSNIYCLPTKVIYGANASGKTNLILGIRLLKEIIINKGIDISGKNNPIINNFPVYSFLHDIKKYMEPIEISIDFIYDNNRYNYYVRFVNNSEPVFSTKVIYEKLLINSFELFERTGNRVKIDTSTRIIEKYYKNVTKDYLKQTEKFLNENGIKDKDIFTSWYSVNNVVVDSVLTWFKEKIDVFLDINEVNYHITPEQETFGKDNKGLLVFNENIDKLLKNADFGDQRIVFNIKKNENGEFNTHIQSEYVIKGVNKESKVLHADATLTESRGTLKILLFLAPFIESIKSGTTLIVDELDSSINAELIAGIISVYSDPEINKKNAQLIFTTHNPVYLNASLFRRDEILFLEKNKDSFITESYTLDDVNIRKDQQYLKNFLAGKYITLPFIDFGSVINKVNWDIKRTEEPEL